MHTTPALEQSPGRRPGRAGVATTEYIVVLAVVSIALLGAVTLLGRRIARHYARAERTLSTGGAPEESPLFPTGVSLVDGRPPTGQISGPNAPDDNTQDYESILGGAKPAADLARRAPIVFFALPDKIKFPTNVNEQTSAASRHTRPDDTVPVRRQLEHGATLMLDKDGNLILANGGQGRFPTDAEFRRGLRGTFHRNPAPLDDTTQVVGGFHTHPAADDHAGTHARTFSPQDVAAMFQRKDDITMLQTPSGEQWVLLRTDQSWGKDATAESVQRVVSDARAAERRSILDDAAARGVPAPPEHLLAERVSEAGVRAAAREFHLGLYRGRNGQLLDRILP
ncbi:MAG: hypothetical protein HYZ53_21825 [Planctomycetes bacterium]|nr:hypothetical protein [Planctomycetota bacterium]